MIIEMKGWEYAYPLRVLEKIKNTQGLVPVSGSGHFTVSGVRFEVIDDDDGQVYEVRINPLYKKKEEAYGYYKEEMERDSGLSL